MSLGAAVTFLVLSVIPVFSVTAAEFRVPFQLKRNVVIIPTCINGSDTLELILDTGMGFDGVYLFNDRMLKMVDSSGIIQVQVPGAGSGEASTALMIENGRLSFGEVTVDSQRVIISTSEFTQDFQSDGVIGWNLFGHFVVGINYDEEVITLFRDEFAEPDSSWRIIPITLKGSLPFLNGRVEVAEGEVVNITMYIDLASEKALELLMKPDQKYTLPDSLKPSYLGTGLSGDVYGSLGKSRHLRLGDWALADIPTAFAPSEVRSRQEGADGVLGNDCIRRFNVIFDYPHNRLLIKPSKYLSQPFGAQN